MDYIYEYLNDFKNLLYEDKYISRKDIDRLLFKYNNLYLDCNIDRLKYIIDNPYKIVDLRNNKYINNKLIIDKNYFDNIFDGIILDIDQRKAILDDEDYSLIIAGAGSGKTTTMAAKVKYLIEKRSINPKDIIILAFTNKACDELKSRLSSLNIEVLTFHKLGILLIKLLNNNNISIIDEKNINKIIIEYITKYIFENKSKLKEFINAFNKYISFDNKCLIYNTFKEYFEYYKNKQYNEINNIKEYCDKQIKKRLTNNISITGKKYKSKSEVLIENFFIINKTNYLFNLNLQYNYNDSSFIEKFIIFLNESYYNNNIIEYEDIFNILMFTSKEKEYYKLINLFNTFIIRFKEMGNDINDFDNLINNTKNNVIKKQLEFLKEFYIFYEDRKHIESKMDFSDIINNAYKYLDKLKDKFKLKYLLIDEYQDISIQRFKFVKKISDIFNTKIVAVGDDWQSIYSFSGSNIDMFKRFNELMGYSSIIRIQNTYRNSQELLDLTTSFVSKDISTFKKNLKSNKHFDNPIEICYYNYEINNKIDCLVDIIKSIYKNHPNDKILILGRFNQEKEELLNSGSFSILNDKLICNIVKANIDFLSVHSSKGLGYDYVIILNALNSKYGFPSKIEDDALLKLLNNKEKYKYAEERRLFYVALTRTKNKVYILCPDRIDKRSEFVIELENERRKYERSI